MVAVLATTAACSSGASGSTGGAQETLNMVESLTAPDRTVLLKSMIADFEKANPNIQVNLISPPTESADQKIQQMLQSQNGIDVMEVRDFTAGSFSTNGWLYDMTDDLNKWPARSDLTDAAQQGGKVKGHSYFVPYGFYLGSLFYRKDLVSKAGFPAPPHSWDDVLKQAEAINNPSKNVYGYAFRGAKHSDFDLTQMIMTYLGNKVQVSNAFKLKDGSTIFTAPEAKQAVNTYAEIFKKVSPPSAIAWGYPEQVQGFNSGTTAFLMQSQEIIAALNKSTAFSPDQYATAPLPVGPMGTASQVLGSAGWGVAKSSKHIAASVKLVEFLTSGAESIKFAKGNFMVPNVKSADSDPFFKSPPWAAFATMDKQPNTYLLVTEPDQVSWWTAWQAKADADVQNLLLGKMTTDALLSGWDKYWTDKWKNAG
jgi:multiple sugar transport system substrate-binding protein